MSSSKFLFLIPAIVIITFSITQSQAPIIQWQKCFGGSGIDGASDVQKTNDGGYVVLGSTNSTDHQVSGLHGSFDIWVIKLDSAGDLSWQKCLGSTGLDNAYSIRETDDGGFIIVGYTTANDGDVSGFHGGYSDAWVVKIDRFGQVQWQRCYGGSQTDAFIEVLISQNNVGFILLGFTYSTDGDVHYPLGFDDVWIVKIDSVGNILSEKCYGNSSGNFGFLGNLVLTVDNGLFTSCFGHSVPSQGGSQSYQVLKIDSTGNQEFFNTYGGFEEDEPSYNIQTSDGNFLVVGKTRSIDGDVIPNNDSVYSNIWIIKVDSNGNLLWSKTCGGNATDEAFCVMESPTNGFIIGAESQSYNGDLINSGCQTLSSDWWIFEIDSSGQNILWKKCYGGSGYDYFGKMRETSDGFIVVGSTYSNDGDVSGNHGSMDFWVVKLSNPSTGTNTSAPAASKLSINLQSSSGLMKLVLYSHKNETASIQLFDLLGRQLLDKTISVMEGENRKNIVTPFLSKGVYLIQYISGDSSITLKVLTQD